MSDTYFLVLALALFLLVTLIVGGCTLGALRFMYEQETKSDDYLSLKAKKESGARLNPDEEAYESYLSDKLMLIVTLDQYNDALLAILIVLTATLAILRFIP